MQVGSFHLQHWAMFLLVTKARDRYYIPFHCLVLLGLIPKVGCHLRNQIQWVLLASTMSGQCGRQAPHFTVVIATALAIPHEFGQPTGGGGIPPQGRLLHAPYYYIYASLRCLSCLHNIWLYVCMGASIYPCKYPMTLPCSKHFGAMCIYAIIQKYRFIHCHNNPLSSFICHFYISVAKSAFPPQSVADISQGQRYGQVKFPHTTLFSRASTL